MRCLCWFWHQNDYQCKCFQLSGFKMLSPYSTFLLEKFLLRLLLNCHLCHEETFQCVGVFCLFVLFVFLFQGFVRFSYWWQPLFLLCNLADGDSWQPALSFFFIIIILFLAPVICVISGLLQDSLRHGSNSMKVNLTLGNIYKSTDWGKDNMLKSSAWGCLCQPHMRWNPTPCLSQHFVHLLWLVTMTSEDAGTPCGVYAPWLSAWLQNQPECDLEYKFLSFSVSVSSFIKWE